MKFHVKPFNQINFEYTSINIPDKEKLNFQNALEYIFEYPSLHILVKNSFYDDCIDTNCLEPRFQKQQTTPNTPYHRMLISQQYTNSIRMDELVVDILENRFQTRIFILEKNRTTSYPYTLQFIETETNKYLKNFTVILHDTHTMEFYPLKIQNKIIHDQFKSTFLKDLISSSAVTG